VKCGIIKEKVKGDLIMDDRLTRGEAIRQKCLDCCCWQSSAIRFCTIKKCPLWRFRMGYELKDELTPLIIGSEENIEPSE
jgi:hypothetical protein